MAINKVVYKNRVLIDLTDTTAVAADVASDKYFYLASGEKVIGTGSGGSANVGTKTITANGTYDAGDDSLDGYSEVTVNVPDPADYTSASTALGISKPMTSGIEALTTYANEITGESDTTLSDAVRSLADGYSGAIYFTTTGLMYTANYESPAAAQTIQLYECDNLETVYAPNATTCGQYAGGRNCKALRSVHFPKCAVYPQYFIRQQGGSYNKLESVTVGSIGYPVTSLAQRWRYGSHAQTLTVTIYVNAETLADIPTGVSTYAVGDNTYAPRGSVVNVVYRNSNTGNVIAT